MTLPCPGTQHVCSVGGQRPNERESFGVAGQGQERAASDTSILEQHKGLFGSGSRQRDGLRLKHGAGLFRFVRVRMLEEDTRELHSKVTESGFVEDSLGNLGGAHDVSEEVRIEATRHVAIDSV